MSQPTWKLLGNLGDVNFIDYGGLFVYRDTTGVYDDEIELLVSEDQHEVEANKWTVYRFSIPKCALTVKPTPHGMAMDSHVLSDNKYHPECPAWFAKPELESLSRPQDSTYL